MGQVSADDADRPHCRHDSSMAAQGRHRPDARDGT